MLFEINFNKTTKKSQVYPWLRNIVILRLYALLVAIFFPFVYIFWKLKETNWMKETIDFLQSWKDTFETIFITFEKEKDAKKQ